MVVRGIVSLFTWLYNVCGLTPTLPACLNFANTFQMTNWLVRGVIVEALLRTGKSLRVRGMLVCILALPLIICVTFASHLPFLSLRL